MSQSELSDTNLEGLLNAVTDALLTEEGGLDAIIDRYQVPRAEVNNFLWVIRRLHLALVGVQPSPRFVKRLRQDLIGSPGHKMVSRMRHLPLRVQIAAGFALIAGFMFIQRRRMVDDAAQDAQEITLLQTDTQ